jgi:hypothetical protein
MLGASIFDCELFVPHAAAAAAAAALSKLRLATARRAVNHRHDDSMISVLPLIWPGQPEGHWHLVQCFVDSTSCLGVARADSDNEFELPTSILTGVLRLRSKSAPKLENKTVGQDFRPSRVSHGNASCETSDRNLTQKRATQVPRQAPQAWPRPRPA